MLFVRLSTIPYEIPKEIRVTCVSGACPVEGCTAQVGARVDSQGEHQPHSYRDELGNEDIGQCDSTNPTTGSTLHRGNT